MACFGRSYKEEDYEEEDDNRSCFPAGEYLRKEKEDIPSFIKKENSKKIKKDKKKKK